MYHLNDGGLFMKCPECGFECLPGDAECLACGVHIGAALENKEKERIRAIEANERKAQYELELKKELGLIPTEDEKTGAAQNKTLEETFKKKPSCPKCGTDRDPQALECVRCGVIFDKFKYGSTNAVPKDTLSSFGQRSSGSPDKPLQTALPLSVFDADKTDEINLEQLNQLLKEHPIETPGKSAVEAEKAETGFHDPVHDQNGTTVSEKPAKGHQEKIQGEVPGPKSPRTREFNIRTFQKPESTWDIYRNKISRQSGHAVMRFRSFWNGFEQKCGSRNNALITSGLMVFVLVILFFSPAIFTWSSSVYQGFQEKTELKRQKKVAVEFFQNKDGIVKKFRQDLEKGNFKEADKMLAAYDVPTLKKDLTPLKNYYEENQILKSLEQIPDQNYESKFKTYSRLVELNSQNDSYREGLARASLEYAENLYTKAVRYHNTGKKDPDRLDQAIRTIKQAVQVMPNSMKYQNLKTVLMNEKLLFYEGNDKIAMAVRDDGMGGRLFSGQRKISVWVLNKSQERVFINVQYFTMLGKNGIKYTYNDTGSKLSGKLDPGEQTWGELYFRTGTSPSKITFNHLVCGSITREFP